MPFLTAIYQSVPGEFPRQPWDEELLLVATDGSGTVWRVCQHHNLVRDPVKFDDGVFPNVSPCGRYALFTSSMHGTLGVDQAGNLRTDVFLVALRT